MSASCPVRPPAATGQLQLCFIVCGIILFGVCVICFELLHLLCTHSYTIICLWHKYLMSELYFELILFVINAFKPDRLFLIKYVMR